MERPSVLLVVNVEWYFLSHRLPLALALQRAGYDVTVAANDERGQGYRIVEAGLRYIPLNLRRASFTVLGDLRLFISLVRLYARERPAAVHHVTIKPVIYGSIAAKLTRVPVVINAVAGRGYLFGEARAWTRIVRTPVRWLYRLACSGRHTRVILQNPEDCEYFVERGIVAPGHALLIRGAGVDVDVFTPGPEPPGVPTVLLASRLLRDKGVFEFVDAVRAIKAAGVVCRGVIVGIPDGHNPNSVPLETLREWHDRGDVEWWGLRDDMPAVMRQSAVVCLPTYYPEGVPKILIEGASAGRPLVATDTPGCREIVRHGENGLLVPPRNVPALAEALHELIRDPSTRARFGRRSREVAVEEFSEELVVTQTLAVYRQLLADARTTA